MRCVAVLVLVGCVACAAGGGDLKDCRKATAAQKWEAARLACTKAAEQGHAHAQASIGVMYDNGWGVPLDHAKAFEWLTKAAEQGDAIAQSLIAGMYEMGDEGVPKNTKMAYYWYNLAAALESHDSLRDISAERRDRLEWKLTSQELAEAQQMSAEWLEKFQRRQKD